MAKEGGCLTVCAAAALGFIVGAALQCQPKARFLDVNQDGIHDMVLISPIGNAKTVYLGQRDGTYLFFDRVSATADERKAIDGVIHDLRYGSYHSQD